MIVFLAALLMILGLIGRMVYLMVFDAEYYQKKAEDLHERERKIKAARGEIIDTNGTVLATNRTVCTISVIHSQIKEPEVVIKKLSKCLSMEEAEVRKRVEKVSSYLVTEPYGGVEQDDFLNACLCLKTFLSPSELLARLHEIEAAAHRERIVRWGPRTLDLDILMYDDLVMETEDLIIPHVEMHLREFVLRPLSEIAPGKRHPVYGKTVTELLRELEK